MNKRQRYALLHPLNSATVNLEPYRKTKRHPAGLLIQSILAVDR